MVTSSTTMYQTTASNKCIKSPILDDVVPLVGDKPRSLGYLGMALLCAVYFCSHGDVLRLWWHFLWQDALGNCWQPGPHYVFLQISCDGPGLLSNVNYFVLLNIIRLEPASMFFAPVAPVAPKLQRWHVTALLGAEPAQSLQHRLKYTRCTKIKGPNRTHIHTNTVYWCILYMYTWIICVYLG